MFSCLHRLLLSRCIVVLYSIRLVVVHLVRPIVNIVIDAGSLLADVLAIVYTLAVPDLA